MVLLFKQITFQAMFHSYIFQLTKKHVLYVVKMKTAVPWGPFDILFGFE